MLNDQSDDQLVYYKINGSISVIFVNMPVTNDFITP